MQLKAILLAAFSFAAVQSTAQDIDAQLRRHWMNHKDTELRATAQHLPEDQSARYLRETFIRTPDKTAADIIKRYYGLDEQSRIHYLTADLLETTQRYRTLLQSSKNGQTHSLQEQRRYQQEIAALKEENARLAQRASGTPKTVYRTSPPKVIYKTHPVNEQLREEQQRLRSEISTYKQQISGYIQSLDVLGADLERVRNGLDTQTTRNAQMETELAALQVQTEMYADSLKQWPEMPAIPHGQLHIRIDEHEYILKDMRIVCEGTQEHPTRCVDITDILYDHYQQNQ